MRETYHHGNLPQTLVREAAKLLAERGADGFSMREVARRAGVAVAAPSHHFGNAKGLITAVAILGFETLTKEFDTSVDEIEDPCERVVALCHTYLEMGVRYPGYATAMFGWHLLDQENDRYCTAASAAFDRLCIAVSEALPKAAEPVTVEITSKTLWATMHGFVALSMAEGDEARVRVRFAVRALLSGNDK